jgi:hypothetical protein
MLFLVGGTIALATTIGLGRDPDERVHRQLPGIDPYGFIQLPNQWKLRPVGTQTEVGDFPVHAELHPSGRWLAILHAGYGTHEVVVLELKGARPRIVCRAPIDQAFYGLCFSPDGNSLFVSGGEFERVHQFSFEQGYLYHPRTIPVAEQTEKFVPGGMTTDSEGKSLIVCGTFGDALERVSLSGSGDRVRIPLGKKSDGTKAKEAYPYTCLLDRSANRIFVSLWNRSEVAVLDLSSNKIVQEWATDAHPTEMALSPNGKRLFVACSNSTRVSIVDTVTGQSLQTLSASLYPQAPTGNTPNSLSLTPDGEMLFVANADANNIAVFNVSDGKSASSLGFIPVGRYPTSVRFNPADKRIYVTNGKGILPKANRQGPRPDVPGQLMPLDEYIAGLYRGAVTSFPLPSAEQLLAYTKRAYACSPLREDANRAAEPDRNSPIPARIGAAASPIKHCVYIIKENRTYDQVFGDMKEGNGDPNLCLFPEEVSPNHHKLAREFVLLDNIYVDGEVSADGHQWSMGAYATDFVQKYWPISYRGSPFKKFGYPSEGNFDDIARGAGGYIWDKCAEAGVSYFSLGEWVQEGKTAKDPAKPTVKALESHFDPQFRGFDMDYPDQKRADRFIEVLKKWENDGSMPSLVILRLPNDHTSGARVGKPTPRAYVADNDLALGRVVETLSQTKFWSDSAVFVIEDDAQNGPDHVDAHRVTALVASPYTKRNFVDSTMYSTSSMLRTMELILGLKPMSQFDAAALPMYRLFQSKPDLRPYAHVPARIDLGEKNKANAWGAKMSAGFNLAKEDAVDDLLLNEVIWRSVKGANSKMPAPVTAGFFRPTVKKDDDDD